MPIISSNSATNNIAMDIVNKVDVNLTNDEKIKKYQNIVDFYNMLKVTPYKDVPTSHNNAGFVNRLNTHPEDDLKVAFFVAYSILNNIYRLDLSTKRAKNIRQNVHAARESGDVKGPSSIKLNGSPKTNKQDYIPELFNNCTSKAIKIAVALFLRPAYAEALKRDFIASILNDESKHQTVENVITLCTLNVGDVRTYIKNVDNVKLDIKSTKSLLCGLIEVSDFLRDRACSKLGIFINQAGYIALVQQYMMRNQFNNIVVFEPIINLYVKESIAKFNQETERARIFNQFKENPQQTIEVIINGLPQPNNKVSNASTKACYFKPDQKYQYYKGVPNYTRDIITTYHMENNNRYRIQTYNDCLYDVLGCTKDNVEPYSSPDSRSSKHELYDMLPWSERLNLIRYRTKVLIEDAKGSDLNAYQGNSADFTVEWIDDNGVVCSKTHLIKKSEANRNKMLAA